MNGPSSRKDAGTDQHGESQSGGLRVSEDR